MKIEYDKTPYFSITESKPFYKRGNWWIWEELGGSSLWQKIKARIYRGIK